MASRCRDRPVRRGSARTYQSSPNSLGYPRRDMPPSSLQHNISPSRRQCSSTRHGYHRYQHNDFSRQSRVEASSHCNIQRYAPPFVVELLRCRPTNQISSIYGLASLTSLCLLGSQNSSTWAKTTRRVSHISDRACTRRSWRTRGCATKSKSGRVSRGPSSYKKVS